MHAGTRREARVFASGAGDMCAKYTPPTRTIPTTNQIDHHAFIRRLSSQLRCNTLLGVVLKLHVFPRDYKATYSTMNIARPVYRRGRVKWPFGTYFHQEVLAGLATGRR